MKLTIKDRTYILFGLFIAALVLGNILGTKITQIWIFNFSVGIFAYPVTFLITDIIEEVHGKELTKKFVFCGMIALVFMLLITFISVKLPYAERSWVQDAEYGKIFGMSLRLMIASIIAFVISQFHDVWAFNFWKQKTHGKFLWLRNNLSTIVSQFIDTIIFMFIAFWNVSPKLNAHYVFFGLALPYYGIKVIVALLDTPFIYLGVWWLKGKR